MRPAATAVLLATMFAAGCARDVARVPHDTETEPYLPPAADGGFRMLAHAEHGLAEDAVAAASVPVRAESAMLIRTGSARVEVDSLDRGIAAVRALAAELDGIVANSTVQTARGRRREATLELRVPAERFDAAVAGLTPVGRVQAVNVHAQDVGEEYVDAAARLASLRQLEARLLEILRTRTGRLDEVLAVERELARVRSEIERLEGRVRHLERRVATSSLSVSLHEPEPLLAGPGPNVLGQAARQAWHNFIGLVALAIAASGVVVPVGAATGLAVFAAARLRRLRRPDGGPAGATTAAG